jgi:biofilm protein TabA
VIIDTLDNIAGNGLLTGRLAQAVDFLRTADVARLPTGKHEIDGARLFALVAEYVTRPLRECKWEAHQTYTDVQYIVRGVERMGYVPIETARVRTPYDPARDVAFFEPGGDFVTVRAGMVAVFGPRDVHAPGVEADGAAPVRKVVIKVAT